MPNGSYKLKLGLLCLCLTYLFAFYGCNSSTELAAMEMTGGGNPAKGKDAIHRYGCSSCHTIPGVDGANGLVGPPLNQIAHRVYLAGRVENTPENMMLWIQNPQGIDDKTAMPNLSVTEKDARDIASYLYTLK